MANINKNIIMQAGAAVANAANKAAGLPAATPEPGSIISVIQLVNGGRTIGPAALAHFTESVRNKLLSLLVSIKPIQDFNGYGHPWPAGGGKNLLGINRAEGTPTPESTNVSPRVLATDKLFVGLRADNYYYKTNVTYSVTDSTLKVTTNNNINYGVAFPVACHGNTAYTLSATLTGCNTSVGSYDADWNFIQRVTNTSSNTPVTFTTPANAAYITVIFGSSTLGTEGTATNIQLELGSTATEWTPYENVCPISGRTGLHVYAGPTSAIGDAATYSMAWTSPAGTVYAGSADIVTGDIKAAPYYASYNGETLVGPWVSSMDVYDPEGTPTTGAQVVDLGGTMTEYHITGQDIITLVGDNYIWSDSGDVTIKE